MKKEKYRILIIDDSIDNLDLLSQLLEGEGYIVLQATNGKYGLEIANKVCPALILLDIKMPGMDGYEVCRRLKNTKELKDIPVIFISGLDSQIDKVKAFGLGGVDYITKPLQAEEAIARVKVQVELLAARNELEQRVIERTLELHLAKEFTERALDAQLDTFFLFELNTGKAIRWNRAFREISGYTDEEIGRMPAPVSYYSPEDVERAAIVIRKIAETGKGTISMDLICKDGHRVSTEYQASFINNEKGEPQFLVSIGRDITERKQAEEKLNNQLVELKRWEFVTLDREDRIRELKREVNELHARLGEEKHYLSE